ncbi:MAG: hypothetical protein K2N01_12860 [Lachnospiraceae bacterium]|nr:hypothetical protein [Lachnospiraceae bacterium]
MHRPEFDDDFHRKEDKVKDTKRQQALEEFRRRPYQIEALEQMKQNRQQAHK